MQGIQDVRVKAVGKVGSFVLAIVVAASLTVSPAAVQQAQAGTGDLASGVISKTENAIVFAATSKSAVKKAAVKDAKAIIKAAKATKSTSQKKLKKIFTYIATPKTTYGGTFDSASYFTYYMAAKDANKTYYAAQPRNLKDLYKKYAIDANKNKQASCYHYASLFAVAAKQALGKSATVKVAIGPANYSGVRIPYHAWTEVKIGKTTYIYDTSAGNYYVNNVSKKAGKFGPYCGTKKTNSKMKSVYQKFKTKNIGYATVTL